MSDLHEHDHDHTNEHDHAHEHDHDHDHDHEHEHEHETDEHIWTSPKNAQLMLSAVYDAICKVDRSALDNTGKVILKDHMRHCMVDAVAAGDQEAIDDLCVAIDKFMK